MSPAPSIEESSHISGTHPLPQPLGALTVGSETPFLNAVLFQQPLFSGLIQAMQDGVAIVNNQQLILLANQ